MIDGQLLQKIASLIFNLIVSNQYSAHALPVDNCLIVPDGWLVNGIWVFVGLLGPMYHLSASPPELTIHSIHYCIEGNFTLIHLRIFDQKINHANTFHKLGEI